MDRRNFFKILSTVSAGVAASSCGNKSDSLIPLLVPNHEIVPGEEQWHATVCAECEAGCGALARVMEGERIIERNGQKFRERIASIKKLEGNPLDPVSGGRFCARGHAALQSLYNPDRLQGPMRRTGARGKAQFAPCSWDDAISAIAEKLGALHSTDPGKILFLTAPQLSARTLTIQRFLTALGAPPALTSGIGTFALERKAAALAFGWKGVPVYDLAQARYVLGVGADFLTGWASPVFYSRQFGHFRQGRSGIRGTLVHAESRMSLTAASADEWLPLRPGSEPQFLTAIARLLLDEKLARDPDKLPSAATGAIRAADPAALIRATGLDERRVRRIARELGESEAPLVIAGVSSVHTNSLDALIAAHYLNLRLGNVGRPGGMLPPDPEPEGRPESGNLAEALKRAKILFLDNENPVYTLPHSANAAQSLANLDLIVSFGPFLDDSAAYADVLVPDHHALESDAAIMPTVAPRPGVTAAKAFVRPLYDTRPIAQTLLDIARKTNLSFEPVTPEAFIKQSFPGAAPWDDIARQGGLWLDAPSQSPPAKSQIEKLEWRDAVFAGAPDQFPLEFQPCSSLQFHDGRAANLPWMQELPDPASSAMWGLPVEIDPQTAARLNVGTGDWVRVESPHGSIEAPAYVHPAALPGVAAMAIGQGHNHYGRFASGRGANPLSILAPVFESSTGVLAFAATRVRIARLDKKSGELIQFAPNDREQGPWAYR